MKLWKIWFGVFSELRAACSRRRTFMWLMLAGVGLTLRIDLAGVTSFVRSGWLRGACYHRLLHVFHSSGVKLDRLTQCWTRLCFKLFERFLYTVNSCPVLLVDGIKIAKEGKKMPGVKALYQPPSGNTKPERIMGHSIQCISLLVKGIAGFAAVPLVARIHEGLRTTPKKHKSLLDKLIDMLFDLCVLPTSYIVGDAYYAAQSIAKPLLENGHHLITRVRSNAVGYMPVKPPKKRKRGRPKKYGRKIKLTRLYRNGCMREAESPVYHERAITIRYRSIQLLWRPLGRLVQFVIVEHPKRGRIVLMTTDLELDPLKVIECYGLRFKIEVSFKQAVHTLGTYAYHFWMKKMTPIKRGGKDQYLHRKSKEYREAVFRKMSAYHRHIQLGLIVQGLLIYLSVAHREEVWTSYGSWMRTMNTNKEPTEWVTATALRNRFSEFLRAIPPSHFFKKFIADKVDYERCTDSIKSACRDAA